MRAFLVRKKIMICLEEFTVYLNYTKRLEFEEKPDYTYLRSLFMGLLHKLELHYDLKFDWMLP